MSRIAKAIAASKAAEAEMSLAKVEFIERFAKYKVGETISGWRYGRKHRIPVEFKILDRHLSIGDDYVAILYMGFVGKNAARFEDYFEFSGALKGKFYHPN